MKVQEAFVRITEQAKAFLEQPCLHIFSGFGQLHEDRFAVFAGL